MATPPPLYSFESCLTDTVKAYGFVEQPLSIDLHKDFTVCARVTVSQQGDGGHCAFFSFESPSQFNRSVVWLGFMWNKSAGARFLGGDQNGGYPEFAGGTNLGPPSATSPWIHIAFTFSSSNHKATIYVNGKVDGSADLGVNLKGITDVRAVIGRALWEGTQTDFWGGKVEKVKVWQSLLTSDQIAQECQASSYNFTGQIQPISYLNEPGQRSVESNHSTYITFFNARPNRITCYWLDFSGKRVEYATIEPGKEYRQQTYVTHPWLIVERGQRDVPLGIWHPMEQEAKAFIE